MFSNSEYRDRMKKVHPEYVMKSNKGNDRWKEGRVFWSVLYPDSVDGNIPDLCSKITAPCILSPLHDQDCNEDGEKKKAHYHFLIKYGSKKNPYQFYCDLVNAFGENAFSTIEICGDIGACVRYLCHLDESDPLKFHYDIDDLKCFGGFECKKYLFENTGDTMDNVVKLVSLIKDKNFLFYNELSDYLMEEDPLLFAGLVKDRELKSWVRDYLRGREYQMVYDNKIEKSYTLFTPNSNGELELKEKRIFNREIKTATAI